MNAEELLELINQQWATTTDITKIGQCGRDKAVKIKSEIKSQLGNNYYLPNGRVPMEKVVEYFNININYLKRIKNLNKE